MNVIIPAFNSELYIGQAIESVLAQTYRDIEIIIVDDGSTDSTKEVVEKYMGPQSQHATKSPMNICYIYQENRGPAAARNKGIEYAQGEYVAFLDADDRWVDKKIETQIKLFKNNSTLELIHTDYSSFDLQANVNNSGYTNKFKKCFAGDIFFSLFRENFIRTSSVLLKRESFKKGGVFNESLSMSEDYDLWLRLTKGRKITGYIDLPLVQVRRHNSHITRDVRNTYFWVDKAIEKTICAFPDVRKKLNQLLPYRLAKNHFTIGYKLFCVNKNDEARKEFKRSLKFKFKLKTLKYLVLTYLSPSIILIFKRIKSFLTNRS
ncbi:MAG: glycosyltransferase family 2 protein [Candidatus Omnitrophica bacterium]|nr:glycosyltransferase family 2 protein [Candidatus Omnitrophota bacterium]